ncbi:substrate-binding domain-containing protein [Abyssibius alkaniclasticus]|uniref:substrate-binding domain-containing protein n=1 Tax=Abyssibius alkaniclasticus TaxID=2881234 RepID=UPI0040585764
MRSLILALSLIAAPLQAGTILIQSTTSTQNSGLYSYLLPIFTAETGIEVNVVAVGTGQAIRNAQNGDADVLLVHDQAAEEAFVAEGYGLERYNLMYNDFVLIGPEADPAQVQLAPNLSAALQAIASAEAPFISRGDDSGTHRAELGYWATAGIAPVGAWYREAGAGMGATIRVAIESQAYTLSDRATWVSYGEKRDAAIVFSGDPALFNQYGIIALNPERFAHVNSADAETFIKWMLGAGQAHIAAYQVDGQQLFFPNAD